MGDYPVFLVLDYNRQAAPPAMKFLVHSILLHSKNTKNLKEPVRRVKIRSASCLVEFNRDGQVAPVVATAINALKSIEAIERASDIDAVPNDWAISLEESLKKVRDEDSATLLSSYFEHVNKSKKENSK